MTNAKRTLIVIAGPTAVGKTHTAVKLAGYLDTEIISCDSRQIYKELSIGTAVPDIRELDGIRCHFVRNKSIHQYYNASMFENEVLELLGDLFRIKDTVILAGGSGMYIDAVCKGIDDLPSVDTEIRQQLQDQYQKEGIESMRALLKRLDPEYYKTADLRNAKRILKAIEVTLMTGRAYSAFLTNPDKRRAFEILKIGLNIPREALYKRINERVDRMIREGLVNEAKRYFEFRHLNALNTLGYKEIFRYLEGTLTLEETIDLIKRNTRKYARRQLTWFRKYDDMKWFDPSELSVIKNHIEQYLNRRTASSQKNS
ncbi:MAG: tRNA (adenosine(37)-N6)-dimethylallyltransferase MiaA [Bacteroidales bacterium]|nr:tRNA (adenosine(37)-N6)-dimethylallyltransferase MiaA [Bacteroidales bacterium]